MDVIEVLNERRCLRESHDEGKPRKKGAHLVKGVIDALARGRGRDGGVTD